MAPGRPSSRCTSAPERASRREELLHIGLVDDGHPRRALAVGVGELAAGHQPRAVHLMPPGRDRVQPRQPFAERHARACPGISKALFQPWPLTGVSSDAAARSTPGTAAAAVARRCVEFGPLLLGDLAALRVELHQQDRIAVESEVNRRELQANVLRKSPAPTTSTSDSAIWATTIGLARR